MHLRNPATITDALTRIISPSREEAVRLDSEYHNAIEMMLIALGSQHKSPATVFSRMRGAFPGDVIRYVAGRRFAHGDAKRQAVSGYDPQLHALHYEWYFTKETAANLGGECLSRQGLTICLGVPTVASYGIGQNRRVILVDQNPYVLARFPMLMRASEIHLMDALQAKRLDIRAENVIFDSPWYLGDSLAWLRAASHLVKSGGTISFSLYPSMVRPTARLERDIILEVASAIGQVDVTEDVLAYQTPLFEWEALKACGVREVGDWRRSDLVVIRGSKPLEMSIPKLPCREDIDGFWKTFVVGGQLIKLRAHLTEAQMQAGSGALLGEIDGSFVLPTVSVRDNRRNAIHVWTSNNRVACSSDVRTLSDVLKKIESGICLRDALQPYECRFGTGIEQQMCIFLLLER